MKVSIFAFSLSQIQERKQAVNAGTRRTTRRTTKVVNYKEPEEEQEEEKKKSKDDSDVDSSDMEKDEKNVNPYFD